MYKRVPTEQCMMKIAGRGAQKRTKVTQWILSVVLCNDSVDIVCSSVQTSANVLG